MSLDSQEQFQKFLETSKNILIFIPENPSVDAIGSAWALYFFLKKKNLYPTLAFSSQLQEKFNFLQKPTTILKELSGSRDFVLSFNTARNKIINLRQEEKDGQFNIFVTPEKGSIDPRDFSFILAQFKYDLIIVLDSPELEKLGKIHFDNSDLFFEVPIVNIDHHSDNDNFGQINIVDVTASSCSEILNQIFEKINPNLIDENIATCLLTGLIGATDSFQKKNTTPRSLSISANLMNKGANQQEIIRWLFKTQPFHILKLLGRAMAKINWETTNQIIWSVLNVEDFVQSRSTAEDLPLIIEKIEENYSEGKIFILLYNDTPKTTIALIKSSSFETTKKIYLQLGGEIKQELLHIKVERFDLNEVGNFLVEKITSFQL